MEFPGIKVGLSNTIHHTVTQSDTFGSFLPQNVQSLLSSPGLAGLMIGASHGLLAPLLPDGFISVGKALSITHEHPSVIGATVELIVTIAEFDGYHVTFSMTANDESGLVGTGSNVRSIVNERWLELGIHRRMKNL